MDTLIIIAMVVVVVLLAREIKTYIAKTTNNENEIIEKDEVGETDIELTGKYRKKQLLSKTEYMFYVKLKQKCDEKSLLICPKVRLEDFIEVTSEEKMKYRGHIKSRHIDFLICDEKLRITGAIELDDTSHRTDKAKKADKFKDNLYRVVGIPLYRVKTSDRYEEEIDKIIMQMINQTKENGKL